ncbi:MAG: zinc ABC transporter substrate-binding protein [candidate division SR1 bacterium]|nr:zinc ABC transporter substrate-binding protein [candidate division SR1 bacterium]
MISKTISPKIKIFAVLGIVLFIVFTFIFILQHKNNPNKVAQNPNITVSTSFYPLYYFAQQVGGGLVTVKNITPAGSEPHEYEPTTSQTQDVYKSQLLVFNGAGLDPWASKIKSDLEKANVKTIDMSSNFTILKPLETVNIYKNTTEEKNETDPHIWLSPKMAIRQIQVIRDELIKIDIKNKDIYEYNSNGAINNLAQLDNEYETRLANCTKNEVITSHNFLQYLAKEYRFKSTPISGISPESEPSSKDLAQISQLVKEKGIKYIFSETLASPKLAETIAKETGAQILVLNPLEGLTDEEQKIGKDYISVQKENLTALAKALDCK